MSKEHAGRAWFFRPKIGQHRLKFEVWTTPGELGPNFPQNWAHLARVRPSSTGVVPNAVEVNLECVRGVAQVELSKMLTLFSCSDVAGWPRSRCRAQYHVGTSNIATAKFGRGADSQVPDGIHRTAPGPRQSFPRPGSEPEP